MKAIKLSILAAVMLVAGINKVSAQSADEVIQKHIDAVGGTDNWNKVKSMKMTGSMSMGGMEIGMTQTVLNDKGMRVDISAMGSNGYTIITPDAGWSYMPFGGQDKVTALPADQVKMSKSRLNVKNGQMVDKSLIAKSEYVGKDTLNSVPCHKLKVTDKEGNVSTCYIDTKTYYIVRTEVKATVQGEEHEEGVNFSNFQKLAGGIVMPMTFGTSQGDITFKSMEVNVPVDESIFKPTEPKK